MPGDIVTRELKEPITLVEYLYRRLYEVGIRSIHGVPGDYNLQALDYAPGCGLTWVGNCNELNAGYAADGYARIKGIAALITTFGVGELSAINAIAGAYSEYVPIVHIVGQPKTASQRDGMLLHHTLGNGDYNVFVDMNAKVTCAVARLNDALEAPILIDDAIRECWIRSRPVYITLPTDMVQQKVEGKRLETPIDLANAPNDPEKEEYVVSLILRLLHEAKDPVILVDACAIRHRVLAEVHDLVEQSGLPTFVAPMGKGAVNETHPNYGGVYAGDGSKKGVQERIEQSDLILNIGAIKSDFNTAGFTYRIGQLKSIDFHSSYIRVRYSEYPNLSMKGVLRNVVQRLGKLNIGSVPHVSNSMPPQELESKDQTITHAWLWPIVGQWLQENDIFITETGTANFGAWSTRFPKDVTAISQTLWGSIGYSVGACHGAALAAKDENSNRRTILFVGDGSFQLTAQEVSTMLRQKLRPIIFVICNNGYTIERFIHGWDQSYNDIQQWNFIEIPSAFGGKRDEYQTHQVKTRRELTDLLANEDFSAGQYLQLVELYMPQYDAPLALESTATASAKQNQRK
ncbi:putative pyruvate decarboxylase PdcA [Talaromyces proteolyticus]|uniref:Pyruvate decarboxylase n=1 Tax=Talaromyces proteolyticus TaxID=1131652 RepID=A0AAD4KJT5_9EURO|nr:putative pyruvate decarboxylase PdcA [Talaromyces proteolyticus]KAH8692683.1 putative pyruvate decarboxylase PdcA [Talaromyces proteolyticus]